MRVLNWLNWLQQRQDARVDRAYPELRSELGVESNQDRVEALMVAGGTLDWPRRVFFAVSIPLLILVPAAVGILVADALGGTSALLDSWQWHVASIIGVVLGIGGLVGMCLAYQALFLDSVRERLRHMSKTGCPKCQLDLRGRTDEASDHLTCPECGMTSRREDLRFLCTLAPSTSRAKFSWSGVRDSKTVRLLGACTLVLAYGQWIATSLLAQPSMISLVLLFIASTLGIRLMFSGVTTGRRRCIDMLNVGCVLLFPAIAGGYPPSIPAYALGSWAMLWGWIALGLGSVGLSAHALMSDEAKTRLMRRFDPTYRTTR